MRVGRRVLFDVLSEFKLDQNGFGVAARVEAGAVAGPGPAASLPGVAALAQEAAAMGSGLRSSSAGATSVTLYSVAEGLVCSPPWEQRRTYTARRLGSRAAAIPSTAGPVQGCSEGLPSLRSY